MYDLDSPRERRVLIVILGIITALGPMAIDLYLPALPTIAQEMGEPLGRIQLTLSAYTIGFALGQIVFGPMSDRFGRLRVMLPGIIGYAFFNLLASMTGSATELMIVRVLQAFSGAAVMVCIPAMVRDMFPGKECARILASVMLVMTVAPLVAPMLGGQILKYCGWPSLFVFLALLGCLAFVLAMTRLKESLPKERRAQLSPKALAVAYGNVLRHRQAMGYILAHAFFFGGMFAFVSGSPFVYIELFGVPAERYGLLFGLNVISLATCNMANMRLMSRFELRHLLVFGCTMACLAGGLLMFNVWHDIGGLLGVLIPCVIYMGMVGFTGPNSNALALGFFPKNAGTANATAGVMRFGIGGITAGLAGFLHDGTAMPMAMIMGSCGALSLITILTLGRGVGQHQAVEEEMHRDEPLKAA